VFVSTRKPYLLQCHLMFNIVIYGTRQQNKNQYFLVSNVVTVVVVGIVVILIVVVTALPITQCIIFYIVNIHY